MYTLVCVPIVIRDETSACADARLAQDAGADIIEYRVDELFSGGHDALEADLIERVVAASPLPCIVTCRCVNEGGHYDGDEQSRVALYERLGLADRPPQYLDIEFASYTMSANLRQKIHLAVDTPAHRREAAPGLIISAHDFAGRPTDLWRRIAAMQDQPSARVVKIAFAARSLRDNLEVFDLLAENAAGRPMIALAMGPFGLMSRVLAPKFGAFLTFAALRKQSTTAPGQPTVRDLIDLYNFRTITPRTRVFGVVGWPVEHSLSPLVHNAGFEALAPDTWEAAGSSASVPHDGVYLPLPVPPEYEHFKATLCALIDHPRLDFSGCSVTLPHKEHLVRFARERQAAGDEEWLIDDLSESCGAANTLAIHRDNYGKVARCQIVNSDASAAASVLAEALGCSECGMNARRVAIVGAGGVARAIAAGIARAGGRVTVINRTPERAAALARELDPSGNRITAASNDALASTTFDAVINATPVGMKGGPAPDASPINISDVRAASPNAVVFDTIYTPLLTPLLQHAAHAGLRTIDGLEMFIRQAGQQFSLWTGHAPPLSLFRRVARETLGASPDYP